MKGVIISLCIAAVIVAGSAAYTVCLENMSETLERLNSDVMERLESEDYSGASEKINDLTQYLKNNRTMLAATGDHEDFDKIEMNISEMAGYTEGAKQTDAISRCKVLDFLFKHLPDNYKLRLENIL